ncbi:peptide/nickel transport system permease protein [Constrictibacter sp. MBR-5]|jgi:peptide/nickel transport system permease protein|uniref:ABC transporter permease n=1 Tax=Constrictibacter sp. MBR-5 TaxID=3156467 RepID=UPI003395047F
MIRFLASRLFQVVIVLLLMSAAIYLLLGLMPGDPVDLMISGDPNLTAEDAARLKALHGLDRPIHERYLAWLVSAVQGDFGYSRLYARPVLEVIGQPLANTLLLMGASFAIAVAIALPVGIWAALRPYSAADYAVNFLCFAGISVPPFWLALLLIMLFAVSLGWLPASAVPLDADIGILDRIRHLVLPVAALALLRAGGITRYVRASMRETLRHDFIRTARAKGMSGGRLVLRHALRNAMVPVVTILALDAGALFSGALITEIMFGWPGMGKLLYDAVMSNDYNLALVGLLFATLVTMLANFGADVAYAALDPRISFTGEAVR